MNDTLGSEADRIKHSKIELAPFRSKGDQVLGAGPKFKRKRSYWRALRRGEYWAVLPYSMNQIKVKLQLELLGYPCKDENIILDAHVPSEIMYLIRKNNTL